MSSLRAIMWREYASFFRVPLGWVVIALFLALSGVFFTSRAVLPGEPASMRDFFSVWWGLLLFLAPAISMRLLSDEYRAGTIESLMTAPVSDASVVVGKYFASVLFLITMLVPTLAYVGVLFLLSSPDLGPIIAGYLGIILLGMLYLSIGTLASALTSSQTLAFLGTLFLLLIADVVAGRAAAMVSGRLAGFILALSPNVRMLDFARGLIDFGSVAYYVLTSTVFLAFAVVALESRRWR